eukprot:s1932_g6.t1
MLFDMSTASTDRDAFMTSVTPNPSREPKQTQLGHSRSHTAAASTSGAAGASDASSLVAAPRSLSLADVRRALDEHCPRKALRANVQRDSHYPCNPDQDLLFGDDDRDSLASALSDIIAEEYGSGPFKVERASQPSAALASDAASALESHRLKKADLKTETLLRGARSQDCPG